MARRLLEPRKRSTASGQPVPMPHQLQSTALLPTVPPVFQFVLPSVSVSEKSLSLSFLQPIWVFWTLMETSQLSLQEVNGPISLSLSSQERYSSLFIIFVALCRALSSLFYCAHLFPLYWCAQNCVQCSVQCRPLVWSHQYWVEGKHHLPQPAANTLANLVQDMVSFLRWLVFNLVFPRTVRSFSAELFSSWVPPACPGAWCRTLHIPLLN